MVTVPAPPTQVGAAIPAHTPHAVSVTLPTWQDNVYYEEGDARVTSKMECGYPRFFIHPYIQKLCTRLVQKFGKPAENGMLFPSRKVAERCRTFMKQYYTPAHDRVGIVRIAQCEIAPLEPSCELQPVPIFIVLFPTDAFSVAKQFWQHTGDIISSRMAEYCLRIMDQNESTTTLPTTQTIEPKPKHGTGRYGRRNVATTSSSTTPSNIRNQQDEEDTDQHFYVEERYGRNLPVEYSDRAKRALKRRIAGVLTEAEQTNLALTTTQQDLEQQRLRKGDRGIKGLSEDDVYLFPSGMSAIFHAFLATTLVGDASRSSVCFGFPYTDTLKILQKFGAGCHFYGMGEDENIDELEALLQSGERILGLFCELPSNPLLKSPNIKRLRQLADTYRFFIVVDETIGNFSNVSVLEWADMVVSSLTKVFSGDSNVMGGSLVLNPNRRHYQALVNALTSDYEDLVWGEDAVFMERNSRDFRARSKIINENAEAICDLLSSHPKVVHVYYPKYTTKEHYLAVKNVDGGFGGLFSLMLKGEKQATQFYDNLNCAKGPSLGTNFTLASPYTILAHYTELDWASQFGVERHLIRVSVGLEDRDHLLSMFKHALDAVTEE
ncbi:pyridoxal phosphate-dependent transferase [Halteromyces radiatus]|uniref:pyridoxal phosphate-dependent transferase n=1 Tax=Halteromyces radiatus TaxID=101107 RepID=UPI002220A71A|nr:pyridoxal phosphate-dependent transferase [Halteromyces radiatus]KAI8099681.1 pyridoxal phosphate-dependent transferase [Halteromyces radiatus]